MSARRKSIVSTLLVSLPLLIGIVFLTLLPAAPADTPPVTEPTVTEPPVTEPPTTEPPVTEPPVTEPPTTVPPPTVYVPPTTMYVEPEPVATPSEEPVGATPIEYWDRMAQCETGGNWQHFPYGTWTGGLGIYNQTWLGWGGGEFAPTAGQATKEQQIIVAERIAADVGYSAWGCVHTVGYP